MKMKSIHLLKNIKNKKILLRVDYNITLGNGQKLNKNDDIRIAMSLPTIQYLMKKGAILILMAHLGRPRGKTIEKFRLDPLAKRLSSLLRKRVIKVHHCAGLAIEKIIYNAREGDIFMLENLRFEKGEEKNSMAFAKKLARLGDIYVNEAFSNSHRNHASMLGITKYLPSYAGLLLEKEITHLYKARENPKRPLIVIMGGSKISTKLILIKKFLMLADHLLIGGALANMILKAKGVSIGKSIIEKSMIEKVKEIELTNPKLHIPLDVATATSLKSQFHKTKAIGRVLNNEYIVDIGKDTIKLFQTIIRSSKTIIWNGPMGYVENPKFQNATREILSSVLQSSGYVIIGGGDSLKIIGKRKMKKNIFLSSGGGAMLEFLEKGTLPALQPLIL